MTGISFPKRSPEDLEASRSVLLRMAGEGGLPPGCFRVIGGMAVVLLCRPHAELGSHVGTFDVDLALAPDVLPGKPELGECLERLHLRPDGKDRHSMYWFADVGGNRTVPVDLLAPRLSEQSPENVEVAGIRAWCPPGTGAVLDSPVRVTLEGRAWGGGGVRSVEILVANGPAVIMAKARSFKDRAYGQGRPVDLPKAGKHAYDFFMISSYRDGPGAIAQRWRELAHHLLKRKTLDILTDDFSRPSSRGPELAAGFIRANLGDSEGLERMVSEQVSAFVDSVR